VTVGEALKGVTHLGMDTAPFIYFVEQNPAYVDIMQAVFEHVERTEELELFTSVLSLTETLVHPLRNGNAVLEAAYRDLFIGGEGLTLLPVNAAAAGRAGRLRAAHNLRTPDALQVATCIEAECDAFVTNDAGFRRVPDLRIILVDELTLPLPEGPAITFLLEGR